MAVKTPDQVWADFDGAGRPLEPVKQEIRILINYIMTLAQAAGVGARQYATKAQMVADAAPGGTLGLIYADPVAANNYPTLWVRNGTTNVWDQGIDRISPLQVVLDLLSAAIIPNSSLNVGGVNLVQRFSVPMPNGKRVPAGITDDGYIAAFKGLKLPGLSGALIGKSADPGVLLRVKGANGRVMLQLHADPNKTFGPWSKAAGTAVANPFDADIIHFVIYGQSLGQGSESLPLVSTVQTGHNAYRFVRGVRTWRPDANALTPANRPASDFELVPLTETQEGAVGETIATGMAAMLKELVCGPNSPIRRDGAPQILVSFAGQGGRFMDELAKVPVQPDGIGDYYGTMLDDVRRAKQLAVTQGKSYAVGGVIWMQGEANGGMQMVRGGPVLAYTDFVSQFSAGLIQMADSIDADLRAISGQAGRIPFFTYQTNNTTSGQAQRVAAMAAPNKIAAVGPTYYVPGGRNSYYGSPQVHGSEVHLSADGERWFGSNVGKAIYRHLFRRDPVLTLRAIMARKVDSTTIDMIFAVPRPPIRIDTALLPAQGPGRGFGLYYWSGNSISAGPAIASVTVLDVDRLQIKTASPLSSGTVTVAYGQLRDVGMLSAPVALWRDGPTLPNGNASKELVFNGSLSGEVSKLLEEGCFFVNNVTQGLVKTWVARKVSEAGGQTILLGEANEAIAGFVAGDQVSISRQVNYGNVCDSDTAAAPLNFVDTTYGSRSGPYPLANWLEAFRDLVAA